MSSGASAEYNDSKLPEQLRLHPDIKQKLLEYRARRAFDAKDWIQKKCTAFNNYMKTCGLKAACVSVSGGVDSAVTLALMAHAKSLPDSPLQRILAISQPIHSSDWARNRAEEACKALGVEMIVVDQSQINVQLQSLVEGAVGVEGKDFARGQLRSYMRTPVNYYVAQLLSQQGLGCVVMGTGNQDEDGYLGYFCKAGDGVVDVQLIADLHKSEVFAVGAALGVPASTLSAPPSADLWQGQTDEEELGFPYDFVELFTGDYLKRSDEDKVVFKKSLSPEGLKQFEHWAAEAEQVHRRNRHKFVSPFNINVLSPSSKL